MRYVEAKKCEVIPIGRQGENEVEIVQFDVTEWDEKYGDGTFTLLHQRSKDTAPYECPIEVNEGTVNWTVRNTDTAYGGLGEAQLIYTVNEAVAKSVIFETKTYNSLDGNVVFPDPYDDWLRDIHNDAEYVREHIDDAAEAEAWAVGERQGVPVGTDDPTYHNNSKYYALQSGDSAEAAADSAEAAEQSALQASAYVGSPLTASLASAMTDHAKVYVYVGTESGMSAGHWYYYNGTSWVDGGVYNAIADDIATNADIDALIFS